MGRKEIFQLKSERKNFDALGRARKPKEVEIDWNGAVKRMAQSRSTGIQVAGRLGIPEQQLYDRCKTEMGMTWTEFMQSNRAGGESMLLEAQFNSAMKGDRQMQIWLGKQYLGQRDKIDHSHDLHTSLVNKEGRDISQEDLETWEDKELDVERPVES